MNTTNQIRNIMMNEMGITKEAIASDINEIIRRIAEKEFKKMLHDGLIEQIIKAEFNRLLSPAALASGYSLYHADNLRDIVISETKKVAADFVRDNVTFNLTK